LGQRGEAIIPTNIPPPKAKAKTIPTGIGTDRQAKNWRETAVAFWTDRIAAAIIPKPKSRDSKRCMGLTRGQKILLS